jgi:hypothetical protein
MQILGNSSKGILLGPEQSHVKRWRRPLAVVAAGWRLDAGRLFQRALQWTALFNLGADGMQVIRNRDEGKQQRQKAT